MGGCGTVRLLLLEVDRVLLLLPVLKVFEVVDETLILKVPSLGQN